MTTSIDIQDYGNIDFPTPSPVIPGYATACAAETDYASSCSCASVTTPTETAPTQFIYTFAKLPYCGNAAFCRVDGGYTDNTCGTVVGYAFPIPIAMAHPASALKMRVVDKTVP